MVSTRRSQSDQNQYNHGDTVEIVRPGSLDIGILLRRIDDKAADGGGSPSSSSGGDYSTHWVVSVEGTEGEEDVSERYLGRVLSSREDDTSDDSGGKKEGRSSRRVATRKTAAGDKAAADAAAAKVSDEESKAKAAPKPTAKATHKKETNQGNNKQGATRTTRRQRGDDSELFVGDVGDIEKVKKRPRAAAPKDDPDASGPTEEKRSRTDDGQEVVKVRLLTGTLYLYKGLHRRAEFIRRV